MSSNAAGDAFSEFKRPPHAPGDDARPLAAMLWMMRAGNASLAAFGALVGALAAGAAFGLHAQGLLVVGAMVVAYLGTAGGNVLNDLVDRELDRTAHPARPLPSGRVTVRQAQGLLVGLWTATLAVAAMTNGFVLVYAAVAILLLVLYELRLKRAGLPGNAVVALLGGSLLLLGGLAVDAPAPTLPLMLIAAVAHLGRELVKDAQDARADATHRRTFAVRHGPIAAASAGAVVLLAAVGLSPLPHLLAQPGWGTTYLLAVVPANVAFVAAASIARRAPRESQVLAKAGMVLALLAFLVAALVV